MRITAKIQQFLQMAASPWETNVQAIRELSDGELATAEQLERMGRRRLNKLMVIKAERNRRSGRPEKMLKLHVETNH